MLLMQRMLGVRSCLVGLRYYASSTIQPVEMAFTVFETPKTDRNKTPIIIMHGLLGSKQNWRGIGRALESKLQTRIFTVDARNHGDSPHTKQHDSFAMAADIKEFMRKHGIPKAIGIGHSMGGHAMMHCALEYPEIMDRTVIVDISPVDMPRDFKSMIQMFLAMKTLNVPTDLSLAEGRAVAEKQMKKSVESQETVDFIMMNLRKRKTGEFYWAANVDGLYNIYKDFRGIETAIANFPPHDGPTLFICGNQSRFVNPNDQPKIQKIFPNSEMQWLDAGHLVHFDQPAKFIDLVVEFVNR